MSKRAVNLLRKMAGDFTIENANLAVNRLAHKCRNGAGTTLANDTDAVALVAGDTGKALQCDLVSVSKVLSVTTGQSVGWTVRIVQAAPLVGSGVLTINLESGTDTWALGSCAINAGFAAGGDMAAATEDELVITGAATNSGFGLGSVIDITCVAANKYLIEARASMLGSGNDCFAFGTQ